METTSTHLRNQRLHNEPDSSASSQDDDATDSEPAEHNGIGLLEGQRTHSAQTYASPPGLVWVPQFARMWFSPSTPRQQWSRVPESEVAGESEVECDDGSEDYTRLHHGALHTLREMLLSSWLNGLLIMVPVGLVAYVFQMNPILVFVVNVIAIIPLSSLLTEATEKIASDAGDTVGALLNISLGNLVELIIFVALVNNQIRIVQTSILGSILVNLLLILGSALVASAARDGEPVLNTTETQLMSGVLFVSVFVFLMPTAFDYTYEHAKAKSAILKMSRMSALMVLAIYMFYFVHEVRSRKLQTANSNSTASSVEQGAAGSSEEPAVEMTQINRNETSATTSRGARLVRFADEDASARNGEPGNNGGRADASANVTVSTPGSDVPLTNQASAYAPTPASRHRAGSTSSLQGLSLDATLIGAERIGMMRSGMAHLLRDNRTSADSYRDLARVEKRRSDMILSITVLVVTSALMSMCAEFLVSAIDDVTHQGHLSESLIGLIILPIVGNIAEYVTVVTVAARDKLDLAIAVAVGSSIQIALCVTPLTIIAGWILHRDIALTFNFFETATLLGTVLLVNLLILHDAGSNARTNGLKGALVCSCYVIIALGAYLSPSEE